MRQFSLKSGDRVFVSVFSFRGNSDSWETVKSFNCMGIYYESGWSHHYFNGLFYGCGYHSDGHALVVKKEWHIPLAVICEKIRLSLPDTWAKKLKLE
jgi:hypothetical protein